MTGIWSSWAQMFLERWAYKTVLAAGRASRAGKVQSVPGWGGRAAPAQGRQRRALERAGTRQKWLMMILDISHSNLHKVGWCLMLMWFAVGTQRSPQGSSRTSRTFTASFLGKPWQGQLHMPVSAQLSLAGRWRKPGLLSGWVQRKVQDFVFWACWNQWAETDPSPHCSIILHSPLLRLQIPWHSCKFPVQCTAWVSLKIPGKTTLLVPYSIKNIFFLLFISPFSPASKQPPAFNIRHVESHKHPFQTIIVWWKYGQVPKALCPSHSPLQQQDLLVQDLCLGVWQWLTAATRSSVGQRTGRGTVSPGTAPVCSRECANFHSFIVLYLSPSTLSSEALSALARKAACS